MDIGTIIGTVSAFALVIGAMMMGGGVGLFFDAPSIMIVIGGTIASTLIAQQLKTAINAFKVAVNAIIDRTPSLEETITTVQELAAKVRKEDLLALENVEVSDRFLKKAIRLAVDGVPIEIIRAALGRELASLKQRHQTGQKVFRYMGATAPAMGMVGTLIGLVQMLQNLSDPSAIGPAMAVALLTTLYGAILAYLIFIPLADKLEARTSAEKAHMQAVMEGIEAIARGENAMIIREKLEAFIAPSKRKVEENGG